MDAFEVFGMPDEEPAPSTVRSGWEVYVGDGVQFERVSPADVGLSIDSDISSIPDTLPGGRMPEGKVAFLAVSSAIRVLAEMGGEIELGREPWRSVEWVRNWAVRRLDEVMPHVAWHFHGQVSLARTIRELIANGLRDRASLEADADWFSMMASKV